jgi:AP endonuclease-2
MLNPLNRAPSTAPVYPNDVPREATEPPRFATKFLDEFSGKQTTLKSFFGGGKKVDKGDKGKEAKVEKAMTKASDEATEQASTPVLPPVKKVEEAPSAPFALARAAFDSLDHSNGSAESSSSGRKRSTTSASIDLTGEDDIEMIPSTSRSNSASVSVGRPSLQATKKPSKEPTKSKPSTKNGKAGTPAQASIASFFAPPPKQSSVSASSPPRSTKQPSLPLSSTSTSQPSSIASSSRTIATPLQTCPSESHPHPDPDPEDDAAIAAAILAADNERSSARDAKKAEVAPIWNNLFAKKLPPMCNVHNKPCKDFIVKIPGPNKGKRFWLCSL